VGSKAEQSKCSFENKWDYGEKLLLADTFDTLEQMKKRLRTTANEGKLKAMLFLAASQMPLNIEVQFCAGFNLF